MNQDTELRDKDKNRDNTKSKDQKTEDVLRLSVSKVAERSLVAVVDRVNSGFHGGRVNRTQVANWIFIKFGTDLSDQDIRDIRAEHFDEVAVLESLWRRAKETGVVPQELRGILQKELGFDEPSRKKPKKSLQPDVINDDISS